MRKRNFVSIPAKAGASVVERAIAHVGGSQAELARQLSLLSGRHIPRQLVFNWMLRGVFPRDLIVHVETLCGIPLDELLKAKPKNRDRGNIVTKAIRLLGADATPSLLAEKLQELSGKRVTRQMVNNWEVFNQFPVDMAPFVHILVNIPIRELVPSREGRKSARRAA